MKEYKIKDLKKTVEDFINVDYNTPDGRYQSWNFCYKHFREIFKKDSLSQKDRQQAALVLAFYLASWGMYRGSSFLLKAYTYTVHIQTIRILHEKRTLLKKSFISTDNETELNELFKLINQLKEYYSDLKKKAIKQEKVSNKNDDISDTLISKIVMGVSGIIPAYDRNVKKELKRRKLSQTLSKKCYTDLWKLYKTNEMEIKDLHEEHREYPPMKILDMYLFEKGSKIKD